MRLALAPLISLSLLISVACAPRRHRVDSRPPRPSSEPSTSTTPTTRRPRSSSRGMGWLEEAFKAARHRGQLGLSAPARATRSTTSRATPSTSARPPAPRRSWPRQRHPDQDRLHLRAARVDRARRRQGLDDHRPEGPEGQEGRGHQGHRPLLLPPADAERQRPEPGRHRGTSTCSTTTDALALERGQVDAWAGLDPHMAASELAGRQQADLPQQGLQHLRLPQRPRGVPGRSTRRPPRRSSRPTSEPRKWILDNPDEAAQILADEAKLSARRRHARARSSG